MKNALYPFILLIAAYLAAACVASAVASAAPAFYHSQAGSYTMQSFHTIVIFGLPAILSFGSGKAGRISELGFRQTTVRHLLLAVLMAAVSQPLVNLLAEWNSALTFPQSLSQLEEHFRALEAQALEASQRMICTDSYSRLLLNILVMALLPAFCEEMFFRGAVQQLLGRMLSPHVAVWFAAFVFAAVHFQFFGFVPRLLMGAALGYMFLCSGSLWTAVVAHFVNNAIIIAVGFYEFNSGTTLISTLGTAHTWAFALASAAMLAALFLMYRKTNSNRCEK